MGRSGLALARRRLQSLKQHRTRPEEKTQKGYPRGEMAGHLERMDELRLIPPPWDASVVVVRPRPSGLQAPSFSGGGHGRAGGTGVQNMAERRTERSVRVDECRPGQLILASALIEKSFTPWEWRVGQSVRTAVANLINADPRLRRSVPQALGADLRCAGLTPKGHAPLPKGACIGRRHSQRSQRFLSPKAGQCNEWIGSVFFLRFII